MMPFVLLPSILVLLAYPKLKKYFKNKFKIFGSKNLLRED